MDEVEERIRTWVEVGVRIPSDDYSTRVVKCTRKIFEKGNRQIPTVILWHRIIDECDHYGVVLPQFFFVPDPDHIGLKSKYYASWVIANDDFPERRRLKEMPVSVFEGKFFNALVVDKVECWHNGIPKPEKFWKSKVDIITESIL